MVAFFGSPPKRAMLARTQRRAACWEPEVCTWGSGTCLAHAEHGDVREFGKAVEIAGGHRPPSHSTTSPGSGSSSPSPAILRVTRARPHWPRTPGSPRDSGRIAGNQRRPKRYHRGLRRVFNLSSSTAIRFCPTSPAYYDRKDQKARVTGRRSLYCPANASTCRGPSSATSSPTSPNTYRPQHQPSYKLRLSTNCR
jgi:hypothetical protein